MRKFSRVLVGATLSLAVVAAPTQARATTLTYDFWVMEHNIAGGAVFGGSNAALDNVENEMDSLTSSIGRGPDMVALEEVCYQQYQRFKALHPGWAVTYTAMVSDQASCGDQAQGQLLASPWPFVGSTIYDSLVTVPLDWYDPATGTYTNHYDSPPGRTLTFNMRCMEIQVTIGSNTRGVHTCVVHLHRGVNDASGDAVRSYQIQDISAHARDWISSVNRPVVVAGDFNETPDDPNMNAMYDFSDGYGIFREGDQTDPTYCAATRLCQGGEPTHSSGLKLDYAFYSDNHSRGTISGDSRAYPSGTHSDHRVYRAFATLTWP